MVLEDLKKNRANAKTSVTKLITKLDKEINEGNAGLNVSDNYQSVKSHATELDQAFVKFDEIHLTYLDQMVATLEDQAYARDVIEQTVVREGLYFSEVEDKYEVSSKKAKLFVIKNDLLSTFPVIQCNIISKAKTFMMEMRQVSKYLEKVAESPHKDVKKIDGFEMWPLEKLLDSFASTYDELMSAMVKLDTQASKAKVKNEVKAWYDDDVKVEVTEFDKDELQEVYGPAKDSLLTLINVQSSLQAEKVAELNNAAIKNTASEIKLAKLESFEFSGKVRDYAEFKRMFKEVVYRGRAKHDIGYRLRQAIPDKFKHLLNLVPIDDVDGMWDKLEDEFGGSRKVQNSVMEELKKTKVPDNDGKFLELIDAFKKIEIDMEAVGLKDKLAHELFLKIYEDLLPDKIRAEYMSYAEEKGLMAKNATDQQRYDGFMTFMQKMRRILSYQHTPGTTTNICTKFNYVIGKTLTINASSISSTDGGKKKSSFSSKFKKPCLACKKFGIKDYHAMLSCDAWKKMSYEERKNLSTCLKHPFSNHTNEECRNPIRKCIRCSRDTHHHLLCPKTSSKSIMSSSKSPVLLKTMNVNVKDQVLGMIEDNCSTESYITFTKAQELELDGNDVKLEIEGINSVKEVDSKLYKVPVKGKNDMIHVVECYGLEKITEDVDPLEESEYKDICSKLEVSPEDVRRPIKIDLLLSGKDGELMSDDVVARAGSLKLFSGPLGLTIGGNRRKCSQSSAQVLTKVARVKVSPIRKVGEDSIKAAWHVGECKADIPAQQLTNKDLFPSHVYYKKGRCQPAHIAPRDQPFK